MGTISRKRLVIISDDFGMCRAVNAGIDRALAEGVLTSATLMAPCPWFADAVAIARTRLLPVGIHFTLTAEWDRLRWSPITGGRSLAAPDGGFWPSVEAMVTHADLAEAEEELHAQIARVRSSGVRLTHADAHMLAPDNTSPGTGPFNDLFRRVAAAAKLPLVRDLSPAGPRVFADVHHISAAPPEESWRVLERWSTTPGTYLLVCHVAAASEELSALCTEHHPAREWTAPVRLTDFAWITAPATRSRIERLGFELTSTDLV